MIENYKRFLEDLVSLTQNEFKRIRTKPYTKLHEVSQYSLVAAKNLNLIDSKTISPRNRHYKAKIRIDKLEPHHARALMTEAQRLNTEKVNNCLKKKFLPKIETSVETKVEVKSNNQSMFSPEIENHIKILKDLGFSVSLKIDKTF